MNDFVVILLSGLGVIITGLCSWVVVKLTAWFDEKIKDKESARLASEVMQLTTDCVKEVYQTFVEKLKEDGKFDKEHQKEALEMCLNKVKSQLSEKAYEFIKAKFGDESIYLTTLIESIIYSLKNSVLF